ncbi:hypothetical protein D3C76_1747860 [compost metagenome]
MEPSYNSIFPIPDRLSTADIFMLVLVFKDRVGGEAEASTRNFSPSFSSAEAPV